MRRLLRPRRPARLSVGTAEGADPREDVADTVAVGATVLAADDAVKEAVARREGLVLEPAAHEEAAVAEVGVAAGVGADGRGACSSCAAWPAPQLRSGPLRDQMRRAHGEVVWFRFREMVSRKLCANARSLT